MIAAGRLTNRVEIQAATDTPDEQGGSTRAWATITNGTVWAEISTTGGREFQHARQTRPSLSHQVTIRYRSGITSAHRLKLSASRVFAITAAFDVDEKHEDLILHCEELVGESAT